MERQTGLPPGPPLLSVVIPVYNKEAYLAETLDSVLRSTLPDLEVICVDDGSSDRSLTILDDYRRRDPRVKILTQDHRYAGAARNAGIEAAAGRYVHFLDADDLVAPGAYEAWTAAAENAGADVCECLYTDTDTAAGYCRTASYHRFRPDGSVIRMADGGGRAQSLIIRAHVVPWNKIYRRDFLNENGIRFDSLICAEDRSFYYHVVFKAERILRLPDVFVTHRLSIGTSLDGSDIRLRHFDVEFRSFEYIWEIVKDAPQRQKSLVLDSCISDSFYYYERAVGTPYEASVRQQLVDYWEPRLSLFGRDFWKRDWDRLRLAMTADRLPRLTGPFIRRQHERLRNAYGKLAGPERKIRKALMLAAFRLGGKPKHASGRP